MTRIHKKRDGLLMIADDGTTRYLSVIEGLLYRALGRKPALA